MDWTVADARLADRQLALGLPRAGFLQRRVLKYLYAAMQQVPGIANMSYTDFTISPETGSIAGLVVRFASRWKDQIVQMRAERRERQQTIHELSQYTDRELADLGVSRYNIPAIANGTYRR
jgi:uncharacterized protein YjiS (DUF1127 family)